jgi:hypothetical protein
LIFEKDFRVYIPRKLCRMIGLHGRGPRGASGALSHHNSG